MLVKHGDAAKLLAGGHSLIPAMKLRLARPEVVIDIGRIEALNIIRDEGGHFVIGAMTTHQDIAGSALLQEKCPLLPETAAHIGDMQVRNRGTIGGSLAHADPAADYPAAILALDAEIVVSGPGGRRVIRAGQFFVDLLQTSLGANEMITEIRVRATPLLTAVQATYHFRPYVAKDDEEHYGRRTFKMEAELGHRHEPIARNRALYGV